MLSGSSPFARAARVPSIAFVVLPFSMSSISFEDFSVALLDEVEHPKHPKARFTIGY
jgi:hypothetical protein